MPRFLASSAGHAGLAVLLLVACCASAPAAKPGVSAAGITVGSRGEVLLLRPEAAILDGGSFSRELPPVLPLEAADDGGFLRVQTHDGITETWTPDGQGHHVEIDASLLGDLGVSGNVLLSWSLEREGMPPSRLLTTIPVARWLDAGAPDPFVIDATAVNARLRPRVPRTLADADCPDDRVVECDGAGNLADEQDFLDSFTGTSSPGCGSVTRSLDVTPGVLGALLTFDDFSDLTAWTLNGRAATFGNPLVDDAGRLVLRLTSSFSESGSAFVSTPVPLLDDTSFRAFFRFRISLPGGASDPDGLGADGMAFVVQSVANTAGGLGGGIGYQGIGRSVGIEFDTWDNGAWDDFSGNHVGIDLLGDVDSVIQAPVARRMNDGDVWSAWVDYDGRSDRLEVRIDAGGVRPPLPLLTATVDLPSMLGGMDAFVGFTSGTGAAYGTHDVLSFVFETYADVSCPFRSVQSVTSTITDECGNAASCTRLFWLADTTPPRLVPTAPLDGCRQVLMVESLGDDALATPAVDVVDDCGSVVVQNDRTAGGRDATDTYPCRYTSVWFDATDDCGNVSRCLVIVNVAPATRPPPVGAALRVRKDGASRPVLDWVASAAPPSAEFVVLVSDGIPWPRPQGRTGSLREWTDPGASPPIRWYDVRSLDCAEILSAD